MKYDGSYEESLYRDIVMKMLVKKMLDKTFI